MQLTAAVFGKGQLAPKASALARARLAVFLSRLLVLALFKGSLCYLDYAWEGLPVHSEHQM